MYDLHKILLASYSIYKFKIHTDLILEFEVYSDTIQLSSSLNHVVGSAGDNQWLLYSPHHILPLRDVPLPTITSLARHYYEYDIQQHC